MARGDVSPLDHPYDLVLGNEWNPHQGCRVKAERLGNILKITAVSTDISDAHRLAVGYNPPGNTVHWHHDPAHHGFHIGGCLKIKLVGSQVIQQNGGFLCIGDITGGLNNMVEQQIQFQRGSKVTRDLNQSFITFKTLFVGFKHKVPVRQLPELSWQHPAEEQYPRGR